MKKSAIYPGLKKLIFLAQNLFFNPNQGGHFDRSIEWGVDSAGWVLMLPECILDVQISQKGSQMKDGIFLNTWSL